MQGLRTHHCALAFGPLYNITTKQDVLLARWAITGEDEAIVKAFVYDVEKNRKQYSSNDAEGEVVLDAPSKVN